jgi:exopolysaccharide production protein ExoZ
MIEKAAAVSREYRTVQALRAIAALSVVVFHAIAAWRDRVDGTAFQWANGSAGVDIFFVISGFVMMVSSGRLVDQADGWREFLRRRFIRIIPLYWLITTAKLLGVFMLPGESRHGLPPLSNIISSYLFLPSRDGLGNVTPVLPVGWTLNFEMLFYWLFALALFTRTSVLRVTAPVLGALSVAALFWTPDWPAIGDLANPLVLEFVFGVCIARLLLGGYRLERRWAWLLLILGGTAIATVPMGGRVLQAVSWGIPAMMIVAGAVSLEASIGPRLPRWLLFLGDASYSIYLVHFVLTTGAGIVAAKLGFQGLGCEVGIVVFCLIGAAILGGAIHLLVEKPITERLKGVGARVPAPEPVTVRVADPAPE